MPRLFGTDGVRGVANRDLTPELTLLLGRAAGVVLGAPDRAVVVGRDTRVSGPMLEAALVAGLTSAGVEVHLAGIVPTPGVAFLTVDERAAAGGVISASHNPVDDNGIKFFSSDGYKLAEALEDEIEELMQAGVRDLPTGTAIGGARSIDDAEDRYVDHLLASIDEPLRGLRVVVDCAYGATFSAAPRAFREAGADVTALHAEPDGSRINVDCGSTSVGKIAEAVVTAGADMGFAFDGDGDRVLAVDERGLPVDGDRLLGIAALHLLEAGMLKNNVLVSTVMANLGFRRALEQRGIEVVTVPVGDRYVAETMATTGAVLGGEQSGHIIFGEHATTGDGALCGLEIARIVAGSDATLSQLAAFFEPFPQVLLNVPVASREGLESAEELWAEVRDVEASLGSDGRVLLRASGTEPVVRVMVEAADASLAETSARRLADAVERHLA